MYSKKYWTFVFVFTLFVINANAQDYNLAKNKPTEVFPFVEDNKGKFLVDNDDATHFYSHALSPVNIMKVDLQGSYEIDRILLRGFKGKGRLKISIKDKGKEIEVFKGMQPKKVLINFKPIFADHIIVEYVDPNTTHMGELEVYSYEPQPVMANQSGYNLHAPKRFTAPLASDGAHFYISKIDRSEKLFSGTINENIGDFSSFKPLDKGPFFITVEGSGGTGSSFPFLIEPYLIERVSYLPALRFMIDDRCWYGFTNDYAPTDSNAGCPALGVAWRDSHQFSFELQALINLYFSNPDAFSVNRMPIEGVYSGLRHDLPANTPEIVKLIHYGVDVYMRGKVNHTLLKEQLAYFLYAYPHLKDFIPEDVYIEVRDYLFDIWGQEKYNRWGWYDITHSANLFLPYSIIGTGKGQFPPGHSVIPNLMMYEVARRENHKDSIRFFNAAFDQTTWLIKNLDWNDPTITKGQRMTEYITMDALSYFIRNYPESAPKGLYDKIVSWSTVMISRSNNMWDFRKYAENKWVIPDIRALDDPKYNPNGSFNEPGNVAGFQAAALAAKAVIKDKNLKLRLEELAVSHIDNVFGRNPTGRHYSFDAIEDFDGADLGWFQELEGGAGMLQTVRGVLDGSPKEDVYPFNQYGGDPGHTEGWVTFNTAWIASLAYGAFESTYLTIYDKDFKGQVSSVKKDAIIGIQLSAPLNFDSNIKEVASIKLIFKEQEISIDLEEESKNGSSFRNSVSLDSLPISLQKGDQILLSYGLGHQSKRVTLNVR